MDSRERELDLAILIAWVVNRASRPDASGMVKLPVALLKRLQDSLTPYDNNQSDDIKHALDRDL